MRHIRTVISLDPEDKAWLDRKSQETGKSMTALVREAVSRYRTEDSKRRKSSQADALSWQKKMRDEWSR